MQEEEDREKAEMTAEVEAMSQNLRRRVSAIQWSYLLWVGVAVTIGVLTLLAS